MKICKAIGTEIDGIVTFSPDDGRNPPTPIIIAPDESGELWYWAPE